MKNAGRAGTELQRDVIALADAAGRELEPVSEDAATLVARVVRQEAVETVLLLAPGSR